MDDLRYQIDLLNAINNKLEYSEHIYQMIAELSGNLFLYVNYKNEVSYELIGSWDEWTGEKILGHPFDETFMKSLIYEDDLDLFNEFSASLVEQENINGSVVIRTKNKSKWIKAQFYIIYEEGIPTEKLISFEDITKDKMNNEELEYFAYYDSLTGLYNRNCFITKLRSLCDKADKEKTSVEVSFIDIDNFKNINNTLGLILGDELVQNFAMKLKEFSSEDVEIGRYGSDVFCIAIFNPCGQKSSDAIYKKIQQILRTPFVLSGGKEVTFTVSCGVSIYPDAGKTPLELLRNAEIVLYKAKERGKNKIEFFRYDMLNTFISNVSMDQKLRDAVENNDFIVYFQPQYSEDKNRLRGAEALVRWPDKKGGFVCPPSVFIPIAEESGLIVPLGKFIIKETVKNIALWQEKYRIPFIVSINVSPIQLKKSDFIEYIKNTCDEYNVAPECIELELTENVFIEDTNNTIGKINALRKLGFKIALDDFGTGYSSLSYLKDIPIDTLKIDKTFIDSILTSNSTSVITESVIEMIKKLGFFTVAEGVETKDQLDFLNEKGCDYIQGFYLGRPVAANEFERILVRLIP